MANLKELKNRISSVKSTQKITKAMKMVAASKLRRAQERAEEARPYSQKMERMLATLAEGVNLDNAPLLLSGRREEGELVEKSHLIIVATADRGLCGGFNSSIVRAVKAKVQELEAKGKKVKILTIGRKGWEQLRVEYASYLVHQIDTHDNKQPEYKDAEAAAKYAIGMFEKGEIDACSIVYNKFVNALTQQVTFQSLIPLDISSLQDEGQEVAANDNEAVYDYEPGEEAILQELLPLNIGVQVFHALLENGASEQGARMTAMDNATRNAGDMIDRLTLQYNRSRQAAITTELIEIIAGAEAL